MLSRQRLKGFTLIELMIVVAIIFILGALGVSASRELVPRFKTRQAAYQMARTLEYAQQLAMTNRQETRVLLVEYDANPDDTAYANKGLYRLQVGNRASGSTVWDTIPFESGATDDLTEMGTVDLSKGHNHYLKGVSLDNWGTIIGPGSGNSDAIVFGPRGMVMNPPSDFDNNGNGNGNIELTFVNKPSAEDNGEGERYVVRVYRSGMVRVDPNRGNLYDPDAGGTPHTTTFDGTAGEGSTSGSSSGGS
jgi:prepilin-type N-terminal cleavage/methylation domain-containing protein